MRRLRYLAFIPAIICYAAAGFVYAQSTTLAEENRRILERTRTQHEELDKRLDLHVQTLNARLTNIEQYLFWLFVSTGAVGTGVGADVTFRYRIRKGR